MTPFSFHLLTPETGTIEDVSSPPRLHIPIPCHKTVVDTGMELLAGDKVAEARRPGEGDIHSPLPGKVIDILPESIVLETTSGDAATPAETGALADSELDGFLSGMGICTRPLVNADTLIINTVPTEPGITVGNALLAEYRKLVELGLETAKRIIRPKRIVMAAAKGNRINAFGGCSVTHIAPTYPNGLAPMIIKAITGQEVRLGEMPEDAVLLSVIDLYRIGRIMDTGRPVTDTIMTVGIRNLRVPIGMPVRFLLNQAGHSPNDGDRVVLGGLMQGITAANMEQGIHGTCTALHVVGRDAYPPVEDRFCMGCNECVRHCPARIMPNMISRAAEFKLFERAEQYYINACIECGICGFYCKARRPLLQYIRYAKRELALLRGACENETGGEA
ncbi:4Fe-4S dicluster domain-containing protein [Salidesulfovibrio onnuriiensis]|uniref:4Fe-4S dicluster domain-containing protein n=1 Tax=Salidesulfovibrio onnuriiensis TaxID=2583823 RepID=UPI00164FAC55|nr:4Fe-4S dicluster domain-containing protein [Salidesulfovibrio onnuriiensis]